MGRRGRRRAGVTLIARGEFSILIAGLAITAGYDEIGPLASAYVLVVGVAGPILARGFGRRPARRDPVRPHRAAP